MAIRTGKEGREKGGWGWLQLQGQDDKAECRRWDCTRLSECHICIHTYVYLGLSNICKVRKQQSQDLRSGCPSPKSGLPMPCYTSPNVRLRSGELITKAKREPPRLYAGMTQLNKCLQKMTLVSRVPHQLWAIPTSVFSNEAPSGVSRGGHGPFVAVPKCPRGALDGLSPSDKRSSLLQPLGVIYQSSVNASAQQPVIQGWQPRLGFLIS